MAGLAGGSAPGCGRAVAVWVRRRGVSQAYFVAESELSLGSRSGQPVAPVEARAGPLVCVSGASQGTGSPVHYPLDDLRGRPDLGAGGRKIAS
jgi:hypothetical protein